MQLSPYLSGAHLKDLIPADQEDAVGILLKQVEPRSNAASLGFETGDIIFGVNRTRVRSIEQLQQYLKARQPQAFRLRRGYEDLILYVR
jgi:S1-C subfamily serine protease